MNLAFVGLGAMGLPMALNLVKAGFPLRGADLNPAALAVLREAGGEEASSLPDAAEAADCLILMVVNAVQAESVLSTPGVLDRMAPNGVVVLMSTCQHAEVQALARLVSAAGKRFVDAPVSGGTAGAQSGTLTIMAAADDETYNELEPVLKALGKRVYHVGNVPGQGAMVKTVNQLLCGVHLAAMAEAFALAAKVDLDLRLVLDIMRGSSASSWMLNDRGERMLQATPEVTSAVDIFVKDLGIVLRTGQDIRASLPIAAAAHQMFLSASARGHSKQDDSQVILSYYELNGVEKDM